MTQQELADDIGIDRGRFKNYWERATTMPLEAFRQIIDHLELDANWLLGRDVSKEWPKKDRLEDIEAKLNKLMSQKDLN